LLTFWRLAKSKASGGTRPAGSNILIDFRFSQQKPRPQALRPAPAWLSFYPAEKKVSKENGGHGMEHFLREVFCGVNYQSSRNSRVLFCNEKRGPVLSAPALIF
jgi:hypothetical protein